MIGILDRMLFSEVFKTLALILGVLLIVLLANYLVRLLGQVATGAIGQDTLFAILGLEMLRVIGRIVPPAFFFSILWVLGRMYRDSEVGAMAAAGIGTGRIYSTFLVAAIPLSIAVMFLVMGLVPWAKGQVEAIKSAERSKLEISVLKPGRFNEFSRGDLVVFAETILPDGALRGLFVQHIQHGKLGIVTANRAYQKFDSQVGGRYIVMEDGFRYQGVPGTNEFTVGEFKEYGIKLPTADDPVASVPVSSRAWRDLLAADGLAERTEFQYRLSFPLAVFAFVLVSVPLARSMPRQGVYGRMVLAVVIYFSFMNLQRTAERWMETEATPAWLGMWWLPVLMAGVAAALIVWDSMWFTAQRRKWTSKTRETV